MAGFMVALTGAAREKRGVPPGEVTRRLIIRGLVLIGVDAVIMGLPGALMGFYSFMVLSSIGVGVIAAALLRNASSKVLLAVALGILVLHPLRMYLPCRSRYVQCFTTRFAPARSARCIP
jgi:uncharacterized membrane protein